MTGISFGDFLDIGMLCFFFHGGVLGRLDDGEKV